MTFQTLVKNIAQIAAVGVPVLGNILTAEQIIEGLVSKIQTAHLEQLPMKPDGTMYTRQDVIDAAVAAHASWHDAD